MEKIAGIKKYEVDEKLTLQDFYKLLRNITEKDEFSIEELLNVLETSAKGEIYFKDLSSPLLKRIQEKMKEIQLSKQPEGKKK